MHKLFEIPYITLFLCTFCAFLWLSRTVFSLLLKKAVSIALWVKASRSIQSLPTYQVGLRNPWLINDLPLFKALYNCRDTFTDVMSALQIKLFMQNKAKFQKVKLNVNKVLTMGYEQMDTWPIGKKQSQTNPNKAKSKKTKMNVTSIVTVDYENKTSIRAPKKQSQTSKRQKAMQTSFPKRIMKKTRFRVPKNKPNTKPISKQNMDNSLMIILLYCIPAYFITKSRLWKNSE